jgi:hypothetical protein
MRQRLPLRPHGLANRWPMAPRWPPTEEIDDLRAGAGLCHRHRSASALGEVSGLLSPACAEREGKPLGSGSCEYDPALYEHQVPGGMISNLRSQLAAMQMEHRLPEILEEDRAACGMTSATRSWSARSRSTSSRRRCSTWCRASATRPSPTKCASTHWASTAASRRDRPTSSSSRAGLRADDVSTERAGAGLPPALPALRQALGSSASDEDLLLAAFYEPALMAPLKKPQPEYQFRTSPLYELIRYLGNKTDITGAKLSFAGTEIGLQQVSHRIGSTSYQSQQPQERGERQMTTQGPLKALRRLAGPRPGRRCPGARRAGTWRNRRPPTGAGHSPTRRSRTSRCNGSRTRAGGRCRSPSSRPGRDRTRSTW